MNVKQLQTLKDLYIQAREENPGLIGINFAVGEMQVSGVTAMLEVAPVDEWAREHVDDTTHVYYKIEKHGLTWTCCFRREDDPAPLPVDDSMSMHFINGEVDYIEPGALIDNDMDEFPF